MFSPTPWRFKEHGTCEKTGEPFGDIIGANNSPVADAVYKKDADAIIAAVNASARPQLPAE